jgi:lactam utilization protein B
MTAQIQYDMFRETTETDLMQAEFSALKESQDKVRRKLFAQNGAMMKLIMQQQEEIEFIKVHLGLSSYVKQDTLKS